MEIEQINENQVYKESVIKQSLSIPSIRHSLNLSTLRTLLTLRTL